MKDRDTIYLVERTELPSNITVICAAFGNSEGAYEYADASNQDFIDRKLGDVFYFNVIATVYYE